MKQQKPGGGPWKALIAGLIVVFLCAMAFTLTMASRRVSKVVDRDYYEHGLNYGKNGASAALSAKDGWRFRTVSSGERLEISVTDGQGRPVAGGALKLELDAEGKAQGTGITLSGEEEKPGIYAVKLSPVASADLKGRFVFTRGGATLSEKVVVIR